MARIHLSPQLASLEFSSPTLTRRSGSFARTRNARWTSHRRSRRYLAMRHVRVSETPPSDRPRERMCDHGTTVLSDYELVALVLRSGTPGYDVVAVAQR